MAELHPHVLFRVENFYFWRWFHALRYLFALFSADLFLLFQLYAPPIILHRRFFIRFYFFWFLWFLLALIVNIDLESIFRLWGWFLLSNLIFLYLFLNCTRHPFHLCLINTIRITWPEFNIQVNHWLLNLPLKQKPIANLLILLFFDQRVF